MSVLGKKPWLQNKLEYYNDEHPTVISSLQYDIYNKPSNLSSYNLFDPQIFTANVAENNFYDTTVWGRFMLDNYLVVEGIAIGGAVTDDDFYIIIVSPNTSSEDINIYVVEWDGYDLEHSTYPVNLRFRKINEPLNTNDFVTMINSLSNGTPNPIYVHNISIVRQTISGIVTIHTNIAEKFNTTTLTEWLYDNGYKFYNGGGEASISDAYPAIFCDASATVFYGGIICGYESDEEKYLMIVDANNTTSSLTSSSYSTFMTDRVIKAV